MGSPGAHFGSKLGSTKGLKLIFQTLKLIFPNLKLIFPTIVGKTEKKSKLHKEASVVSGMFVANDVMSFNGIWQKSLYNFKLTKSNNVIVNHVFHFTRATSTTWNNFDRTLCKYVIVMCV